MKRCLHLPRQYVCGAGYSHVLACVWTERYSNANSDRGTGCYHGCGIFCTVVRQKNNTAVKKHHAGSGLCTKGQWYCKPHEFCDQSNISYLRYPNFFWFECSETSGCELLDQVILDLNTTEFFQHRFCRKPQEDHRGGGMDAIHGKA